MTDISIESHDDDAVTLRVGSITAHITGDGWADANNAAHVLGQYLAGTYELADLRIRLDTLRSLVRDVERSLSETTRRVRDMAEYAADSGGQAPHE